MQPNGTPCWIDIETDVDRARDFYGAIFGWEFESLGPDWGGWHNIRAHGDRVGAIGPGHVHTWQVMLRADDVQAAIARTPGLGGKVVLEAGQVSDLGWLGRIAPPTGAATGLWQPGVHQGFDITGKVGTPVWFELYGGDHEAMSQFFSQLFGLPAKPLESMPYINIHADDRPRFGLSTDDLPTRWLTYFQVEGADGTASAIESAGGTIERAPFDTPFGRLAFARDPMGSLFAIVQD